MKKILLVGATGLIGATVNRKLSKSYEVIRLGRREVCELQADLSKPETLENLVYEGFEAVVHCAGVTDEDFKSRSVDAIIQSLFGMDKLIQSATFNKVKKFIYISTSHVYGTQAGIVNENTPANPLSNYAIAHYAAEQTLQRNAANFENCLVLRPNAVFGQPVSIDKFDRWNLIPYSFPLEAVYNQKIVLRSSGEQNRNLVSTEDIANYVESFLSIATQEKFIIVNPLGRETMSVYQFALKTSEVYQMLTGKVCNVERPKTENSQKEEEFLFQTISEIQIEEADVTTYLHNFISQILEDYKNGKKYNA